MLVEVASHLEDDVSLVDATHVCHLWRVTLLSSPHLWSHLDFVNKERALVYSERSKSAPLCVDIINAEYPLELVRELLKKIATRVTTLWAERGDFLDELLAQPMPKLETLEILDSQALPSEKPTRLPSLKSLFISGFDILQFHAPNLTSLHLTHDPIDDSQRWKASILLGFLRRFPLLEVVSVWCDILNANPNSGEVVSLPLLRSFTHKSHRDEYQLCLLDQLSIPSSCRVVLAIDVTEHNFYPWSPSLPAPWYTSYLSDIRTVKISAHPRNLYTGAKHATFKIKLVNSTHRTISFDRESCCGDDPSEFSHQGFLDTFGSVGINSIETLCFYQCPVHSRDSLPQVTPEYISQGLGKLRKLKKLVLVDCDTALSLDDLSPCLTVDTLAIYSTHPDHTTGVDIVNQVEGLAVSRKRVGSPLKALTLVFPSAGSHPSELERLTSCVGRVEILSGREAARWDVDKYLLAAATHDDNAGGL